MEDNKLKEMKNITFIIMLMIFGLCSCNNHSDKKTLVLHCAAGIKPPVELLAKEYQKKYNVQIDIQYGGSGTLLSSLRLVKTGDLYLAADESYLNEAKSLGLVDEIQPLAYLSPVIAVKNNNPKRINGLDDLLRKDVAFSLGNPDAASIGKYSKKILEELNLWSEIREKVTVLKTTVNEIANDITIGAVDAGIVWDATVKQFKKIELVSDKRLETYKKQVTIGVLKSSPNASEAIKFMRFLSSREFGNLIFKEKGYEPIKGDVWQEKPEILFFSGGVNRPVVEKTIQDFEKREAVVIQRVYNGCGILVSQIKAGEQPDAYLTCDVSFMDQVKDEFVEITDVSKTKIVIAVKKGNPQAIITLSDLSKDGIRIGMCNPRQSALGALTKNLLDSNALWQAVSPNVFSQTPTADLLVNQLRTGSLDAVIVYEANLSQVKDKLTMLTIDDPLAKALQNFGIGTNSNNYWTLTRLFQKLISESSKKNYLDNGFDWQYVK